MARRRFLIAYDIREPRRLRAVHAATKGFGYAIQYSVFVCDLDPSEKLLMRAALGEIINHRRDSIAIVDLGDAETRGMDCFEFMGSKPRLPRRRPQIV